MTEPRGAGELGPPPEHLRFIRRLALIPLTGALLLSGALIYGEMADPSALLVRSSLLHSEPSEDSTSTLLKSGVHVRVLDAEGDWLEVELSDGTVGHIGVRQVALF